MWQRQGQWQSMCHTAVGFVTNNNNNEKEWYAAVKCALS